MAESINNLLSPQYAQGSFLHDAYAEAIPFPHLVIDDVVRGDRLDQVLAAFPDVSDDQWIHYVHYNEKKHGLNRFDALPAPIRALIEELNGDSFVAWLSEVTGIKGLFSDPDLEGGGLHQSQRGGFLRIHSDFTSHPHHADWRRRVNVLVYLNRDWQDAYGGHLELWSEDMQRCEVKISPVFNRCVIFNTDDTSYHGHPEPLSCPAHITRKSIALYYYTNDTSGSNKATTYVARPGERGKRWLIGLDNMALRIYHQVKRTFGIDDGFLSRVLGAFRKWKK